MNDQLQNSEIIDPNQRTQGENIPNKTDSVFPVCIIRYVSSAGVILSPWQSNIRFCEKKNWNPWHPLFATWMIPTKRIRLTERTHLRKQNSVLPKKFNTPNEVPAVDTAQKNSTQECSVAGTCPSIFFIPFSIFPLFFLDLLITDKLGIKP